MKRVIAVVAAAAVVATVGAGGAVAGGLVTSRQIKNDTVRSVDLRDGHGVGMVDLRPGLRSRVHKSGDTGPQGPQGPQGEPGANAQALPYGVAKVKVQRGSGAATPWAVYSTTVGGPEGDTTGGTFRFTCSAANAPCEVSVAAYSTGDGVTVYPRVDIQRQSLDAGPQTYCEYGDGPMSDALTGEAADLTINIGGSADCGGPDPVAGDVAAITVPAGYYDVASTFQFVS